jgi:hypothetical protein
MRTTGLDERTGDLASSPNFPVTGKTEIKAFGQDDPSLLLARWLRVNVISNRLVSNENDA